MARCCSITCRVVVPDSPAVRAALDVWLGIQVRRELGWRGWYDASSHVLDGGIMAWCSDPSKAAVQGVLVDLPGKACAALGDKLIPFAEWALNVGHAAHADFAIDDRSGHVTLARIRAAEAAGGIVKLSPLKPLHVTNGADGADGWTVYFGSRSSDACIRIYDKAKQQKACRAVGACRAGSQRRIL